MAPHDDGSLRGEVGSLELDRWHPTPDLDPALLAQSPAALERAVARFAEQNAHLSAIYGALDDGVIVFDRSGAAVLVNDAMATILGASRATELQRDLSFYLENFELFDAGGTRLPTAEWPIIRLIRGERISKVELLTRRTDTEGQWLLSFSGEPVIGPGGDQTLAVLICRDVTDERRKEAALRASEDRFRALAHRLAEADRRKDDYLAMLGHELRNPLAAIESATELINRTAGDTRHLGRAAAILDRQSAHMARLIDGLLEVSRLSRGKVEIAPRILDLREVCENVLHDRERAVADGGLSLAREFDDEPVWACIDPVRMAQVIDNLLENAIKFTPCGGRITVAVVRDGPEAMLRVRDTGAGIRSEHLDEIFEPFHQEAQGVARDAGGLGLGLSLARGLVELHDGAIRAASAGPGRGSELVVRLPLTREPTACDLCAAPEAFESKRILMVEDNEDAAQMLGDLLELEGHRVELASTGREGLELLRRSTFDIVLCDIGLPGMSGHEFARTVRSDDELADITLVAVTGYGQPEDYRASRRSGFDAHLTKPVSLDALHEVFRDLPLAMQDTQDGPIV